MNSNLSTKTRFCVLTTVMALEKSKILFVAFAPAFVHHDSGLEISQGFRGNDVMECTGVEQKIVFQQFEYLKVRRRPLDIPPEFLLLQVVLTDAVNMP